MNGTVEDLRNKGRTRVPEAGILSSVTGKILGQKELAPRARFELATLRLTAECSTIELPGNRQGRHLIVQQLADSCHTEGGY